MPRSTSQVAAIARQARRPAATSRRRVSNKGRPITPEWLPATRRKSLRHCPGWHSRRPCHAIRPRDIGIDLGRREALEANDGFAQRFAQGAIGHEQGDGGKHAVAAAGKQRQAFARSGFVFRLGQDAAPGADHGIARQDRGIGRQAGGRARLFGRQAHGMGAWQFARQRAFIDVGGKNAIGNQTQPRDQVTPARAGRGQHQRHGRGHQ
jgi:hypothetical protein